MWNWCCFYKDFDSVIKFEQLQGSRTSGASAVKSDVMSVNATRFSQCTDEAVSEGRLKLF